MRLAEFGWNRQRHMILALGLFILAVMSVPAAESQEDNGVLRSRSYKLRHITSAQAQTMLSELQIGMDYDALTEQVLIVTSNSSADLTKVTEVLTILDGEQPVSIQVLGSKSDRQPLPTPKAMIDRLKNVVAGTMTDAPPRGTDNPAIIDMLGDDLIAIGEATVLDEVQAAFDGWMADNRPRPAEPEVEPVLETPTETEPMVAEEAAVEETAVDEAPADMEGRQTLEQLAQELMGAQDDVTEKAVEPVQETEVVEPESLVEETPVVPDVVTETEDVAVEDVTSEAMETEPDADAFMDEGLLEALEKGVAERKAKVATEKAALEAAAEEVVETESVESAKPVEPEPLSNAAQQRAEAIAAMQAQAEAERKAAEAAQTGADNELQKALEALLGGGAPTPVEEQPVEPVEPEMSAAEQEIAMLKAQVAELTAAKAAQEEPETEMPAKKGSAIPQPPDEDKKAQPKTKSLTTFEEAIGEEMLDTVIDLPQEVMLESLVDLVGKQLGLNYLYDATIFKAKPKVTLKIHGGKIKVRDLYALLESVMRSKDFIMTRRGNLVEIMDKKSLAKADPVFRGADDPIQPGDILVSTVFELKNILAADAQKTLTAMKLSSAGVGSVQLVAGSNMLVIKDYAYRMERIQEALDLIDVAGEMKELEYRQLEYMQAKDLVQKLKVLIGEMEGVSLQVSSSPSKPAQTRTIRTRDAETGRMVTKQVPVPTSKTGAASSSTAKKGAVFVDVDERTNRILMVGKRAELETLNQLIDTLDVPQQGLKFVREYIIEHVGATDVVDVLNELGMMSVSVSTPSASAGRTATTRDPKTGKPVTKPTPRPTTPAGQSGGDQPNISVRPATNSLLVNASGEQHQAIELVIAHVDVVQKDQRTIREYEIQYVDTQEIIDTMTDLGMISKQSVSGGSSRSSTSRSASSRSTPSRSNPATASKAAATASPTALANLTGEKASITEQEPQISILEATNSLLVYATPRQHKAISLLIAHADRVPATTTTPYVVYALENQEPGKLAGTLDQIVLARQGDSGAKKTSAASKLQPKTTAAASSSSTPNLPNLEEENIRIIADEDSYSLIVYANKRNQQWIGELIKELDEYRPQVLLDCTLVEITKDDEFNYSINLIAKTYGGSSIQGGSPVGKDSEGNPLYGAFSDRTLSDIQSIAGDVTGFFNSEMIQGVLEAVQKNGYGRIMAQPKVLVNDNQQGTITTKTTTSVPQVSSQTTTTDGVTNTSENVTFDPYEKGIILDILPHISKGDMLRLEITLNRTDFEEQADYVLGGEKFPVPPDLLSTDVTTIATVPDGATIILGGLESVNQGKNQSKVPILGDLPIVGGLFRGVNDLDNQSRLYVFVKANIIRPGDQVEGLEDIMRVSNKYRAEFEEMEDKFQTMQDWPGIDPVPMSPERVLEDDFADEDALLEASESM